MTASGDVVSGGGRSISLGDYSDEWRAHRRLAHSALQRCTQQSLHGVIQKQALRLRQVENTGSTHNPHSDEKEGGRLEIKFYKEVMGTT